MSLRITEVDSPRQRRDEAGALVLEWWCDLACPDCAEGLDVLEAVQERFGDAVVLRMRHFPLVMHVWAVAAAQCAVEAEAQGRGDEYAVAALRACETIDGPADYVELAEHLGLDADAVAEALFDGRHSSTVHLEHTEGLDLGVRSTPTFVVDGLMVDAGTTLDGALEAVTARIEQALRR